MKCDLGKEGVSKLYKIKVDEEDGGGVMSVRLHCHIWTGLIACEELRFSQLVLEWYLSLARRARKLGIPSGFVWPLCGSGG